MSYEHIKRYRHKRRRDAEEYLGGVCVVCGTDQELEFDHIKASTKSFEISNAIAKGVAWIKLKNELDKCQLLCTAHHHEKSTANGDNGAVIHGGGLSGKKNCRCLPCRQRKRDYMRDYMRTRRGND